MSPALIPFTVMRRTLFGCCNKRRGQPMVPKHAGAASHRVMPECAGGLVDRNLSLATIFLSLACRGINEELF